MAQADIEKYKGIAERVLPFVGDTVTLINDAYDEGKRILVEGANATMLDVDFGTYPFVTSSNPSIGGVTSGLGLAPTKFQAVIGVVSVTPNSCQGLTVSQNADNLTHPF